MYIDFMGTDAGIFRTLGKRTAMRTDQYNSRWLSGECSLPALGVEGWGSEGNMSGMWRDAPKEAVLGHVQPWDWMRGRRS